jgi:hypothetical protein
VLKALDTVFFIFAPNLTAIFTYWFALKEHTDKALRNEMAFSISWWASVLWGFTITTYPSSEGERLTKTDCKLYRSIVIG